MIKKRSYENMKISIFAIAEIICGLYMVFWSFWEGLHWLRPGGIILALIGIASFKLKNWIRIFNTIFLVTLILLYIFLFFHLLIIQGYIQDVSNPFFLIGLTIHLPVILFSIFGLIFLRKRSK